MPAWSQHMHILTNSHSCTYIQTFSNTFNHSQIYSIFIYKFSSCQIYSIFCEIYIIVEKYILHACTAGLTCLIQFRIPSTKTKDRSTTHPRSLSISQLHTKWTIWGGILNWQGGRDWFERDEVTEMLAGMEQMVLGIRARGVMWLMGGKTLSDGFDVQYMCAGACGNDG